MKMLLAAALLSAASFAAFAAEPGAQKTEAPAATAVDAQSIANAQEVGQARRGYRASCQRYENGSFCDCLTAGMAQALAPADLRLASRTIRERITAQGDAATSSDADPAINQGDAMSRIQQAEGHYTDVCSQYRGH